MNDFLKQKLNMQNAQHIYLAEELPLSKLPTLKQIVRESIICENSSNPDVAIQNALIAKLQEYEPQLNNPDENVAHNAKKHIYAIKNSVHNSHWYKLIPYLPPELGNLLNKGHLPDYINLDDRSHLGR